MQVRVGWTGETEPSVWSKADVELDESDVLRILLEKGLPAELGSRLPTGAVFRLLNSDAEILLLRRLVTQGYPKDKARTRTAELVADKDALLTAIERSQAAT